MQEKQAVNRVTREHCSSLFHFTAVLPSVLPSLPSALLPIPTVCPWDVTPYPRYYRECGHHYRGFPAVSAVFPLSPLPCRPYFGPIKVVRTQETTDPQFGTEVSRTFRHQYRSILVRSVPKTILREIYLTDGTLSCSCLSTLKLLLNTWTEWQLLW